MQGTLTNLRKELSKQGLVVNVTLMMQEKLGLYCFVVGKYSSSSWPSVAAAGCQGAPGGEGQLQGKHLARKPPPGTVFTERLPCLGPSQNALNLPLEQAISFHPENPFSGMLFFSVYPFPLSHLPTCRVELCFLRLIVERTLAQLVTAGRLNKRQPGLRRNLAL